MGSSSNQPYKENIKGFETLPEDIISNLNKYNQNL